MRLTVLDEFLFSNNENTSPITFTDTDRCFLECINTKQPDNIDTVKIASTTTDGRLYIDILHHAQYLLSLPPEESPDLKTLEVFLNERVIKRVQKIRRKNLSDKDIEKIKDKWTEKYLEKYENEWKHAVEDMDYHRRYYRLDEDKDYDLRCIKSTDPNGNLFALFLLALCGTPEHEGDRSIANGGSAANGVDFLDCYSTRAAANLVDAAVEAELVQVVDATHDIQVRCVNARHCPITEEQVKQKREEQGKKLLLGLIKRIGRCWSCPKWNNKEAKLRADQTSILMECAIELGIFPIMPNVTGINPKSNGSDKVTRDLWSRECVGLVIQRLLHIQFFDSGVDNRAVQQINELSDVLHESYTKLQPKEGLFKRGTQTVSNLLFKKKQEEEDEQEKKTFGEIFMEKSSLSTRPSYRPRGGPDDKGWKQMLVQLKAYKKTHGHTVVPEDEPENTSDQRGWSKELGSWVKTQRYLKKQGELTEDRRIALDDIKFDWDPLETRWNQMLVQLKAYKKTHGHTNVPEGEPKKILDRRRWSKELGRWVGAQRQLKKANSPRLTEDRIKALDDIKFDWDPLETRWNEMLALLVAYEGYHGHTNVPKNKPKNESDRRGWSKELRNWVVSQRYRLVHKEGTDRWKKLNDIGFWEGL